LRIIGLAPILTVLLVACATLDARACSCLPPGDVPEAFDLADAVFSGEVIRVAIVDGDDSFSLLRLDIAVIESWKGVTTQNVSVYTASDSAACGLSIGPGRQAVFYAHHSRSTDFRYDWTVSLCSRTGLLNGAIDDIDEFARLGLTPLELSGDDDPATGLALPGGVLCGNGIASASLAATLMIVAFRLASVMPAAMTARSRRRFR
jgi:hypothetical protein